MERKHNFNDLAGVRFGRWTAKEYQGQKRWLCVCDCGNSDTIATSHLRRGNSRSCGCLRKDEIAARNKTHGMTSHPAYASWDGAKRRCADPKRRFYNGKNIKVHPDWTEFDNFWRDMGPTWAPGLSIDRIDGDGDYALGNCRWATPKVQSNNRSCCVIIDTPDGPMNITQAGEKYGINRWTIAGRIKLGWDIADILKPVTK